MARILPLSLALILGALPTLQAGTPLSKAVIEGSLSAVQKALEGGEKVNDLDKWGWTPLMWSVYYRTTPITRLLLEKGADANAICTKAYSNIPKGASALTVAAYYGLEDECALLVKAGGKADLADDSGITPLGYARKFEFQVVTDLLAKAPGAATSAAVASEAKASVPPGPIKLPANVDGSRLAKSYRRVVLMPFTTSPAVSDDYPGAMAEAQQGALEAFGYYKAFDKALVKGGEIEVDDQTLVAQVEITGLRMTSTAARVIAGPFARKSFAKAKVLLKEPGTGKVLREQELSTENNVWGAAFSLGYSDRSMPRDIGAIVATYVVAVGGKPLS